MPYLYAFLESNLAAARGGSASLGRFPQQRVLKNFPLQGSGTTWELAGSLHWRY